MSKTVKCLFCGREFEWDCTMFKFCDKCIASLETLEEALGLNLILPAQEILRSEKLDYYGDQKGRF